MITPEQYNEALKIVEEYRLQEKPMKRKPKHRYKCLLCGRDKFTQKIPHKCLNGYRKRHIVWEEIVEEEK